MAWTTLTFAFGSVLSSSKMTQMFDNFTAFARGESGAPKVTFTGSNSGVISDFFRRFGDGELGVANITANTAMLPGVYNFTSFTVNSGYKVTVNGQGALIFRCTSAFNLYGLIDVRSAGGAGGSLNNGGAGGFGGAGGGDGTISGNVGGGTLANAGGTGAGAGISEMAIALLIDNPLAGNANVIGVALGGGGGAYNDGAFIVGGNGGGVFVSISDVFDSTSMGQINCNGRQLSDGSNMGGAGASVRTARVFSADIGSYTNIAVSAGGGTKGGDGVAKKIVLE